MRRQVFCSGRGRVGIICVHPHPLRQNTHFVHWTPSPARGCFGSPIRSLVALVKAQCLRAWSLLSLRIITERWALMHLSSTEPLYAPESKPHSAAWCWPALLATDPLGAQWGPGAVRSPGLSYTGFTGDMLARVDHPVLLLSGQQDRVSLPLLSWLLYLSLNEAAPNNLRIEADGLSHHIPWELRSGSMLDLVLEWLTAGGVRGRATGNVTMDREGRFEP